MSGAQLRVLMVTPFSPLQVGGVQRYVWETATALLARGVHVEVLCADPVGDQPALQDRDGLLIRSVPAWPRNRDWCFAPGLWRQIEPGAWDIVHVQSYHTLVAPLAMLRAITLRVPFCVTFHGGGSTSALRNRARPLQRRLLAPLLRRAAALVAVARFEASLFGTALGLPPERFRVIPVGTDIAISAEPEAGAEAEAEDCEHGLVVGSIGRLERYKGHQRVIAALPHLLRSRPEARLMIVGTGPYEQELRGCAAALGVADRVALTSFTPGDTVAMARLLKGMSVVVLMSEFETHPLVGVEVAAARRRLLVADDGAGLRELADDGLARAVPLDSSGPELAAAILEELERPAPTERPRVSSWGECAEALLALYHELRPDLS